MNYFAFLAFYETKKLFFSRFICAVIGVLLLTNCIYIFRTNTTYFDPVNKQAANAEWEIYKSFEGEITEEKIKALEDYKERLLEHSVAQDELYYNEFWDLTVVNNLLAAIEKARQYESANEKLLQDNEIQKQWYSLSGSMYLERQAELISHLYANRSLSAYYDMRAYQKYISYDFSSLLLLLIVFLASSALFAKEKESGMHSLLQSTPLGRKTLTRAKICALTVFLFAVFCVFSFSDFLMFSWRERFAGAGNPIYGIEEFSNSPLNMSVAAFIFVWASIKLMGLFVFAALSSVFSSVLNKSYLVLIADVLMLAALMITSCYTGNIFDILNLFNPIMLLVNRTAFRSLSTINLFNFPLPVYLAMLFCGAFVLCVLLTVIKKVNAMKGARHAAS